MKKRFIIILTLVSFFSCDSYLDEVPDNRQDVKTLEDISELLVSAYSEATYNFIEAKTDNSTYIIENTQYPWMTENYSYKPVVSSEGQDTPTYFWDNTYTAIAHANQALVGLEEVVGGDQDFRNALRGEALVTRAYNHFLLANVFALHYSDANKEKLGIPYITAPETKLSVAYDRGTLEETYNLIEQDLLEGISLISDSYYVGTGKYHFNKSAAYAFASRFYLFKKDYAKCIEYSNKLLGEGVASLNFVRDMEEVYSGSGSVVLANNFISVDEASNLLVVRKESFWNRYTRGFQPTNGIFSQIYDFNNPQGSYDFRDLAYGFSSSSARNPPKYVELFEYTTSTTGFGYFIMPELRSEEVILNRMEAYVMLNRLDDALNDYNVMAPLRYETGGQLTLSEVHDYYGGTEQEAMFSFVISERRKEFLREGLRWFDIKRLELEVYHIIQTDGDGLNILEDVTLASDDLRKAEQIPAKAIANGIEENPGY
ncbi:RagB/SusD family nutrient uptake outer membrane protein [Algibacter pacificus]|uniref:RagB/SusD family nutrient uptake outer membrane protein n=1 Tax=Algibacter pacificus TaxID=2599389 RepID=UPI0011CC73A6|nr:RagB/SusD family nutrient uptake outer membrane protein [Algibacter pacificus]